MQLSLLEYLPELDKNFYLDVFAQKRVDKRTQKPILEVLDGQPVPSSFKIRCQRDAIERYPEGTIFKLDMRLIQTPSKRPYLSARQTRPLSRAIEFFDHNLKLQASK